MTTSQTTPFLSEVLSGETIPAGKLAYFRARLADRFYSLVLEKYIQMEKESGLTRAELARRIRRKPEQITRWFGSPGNWTIETISDLFLGMGCEPALGVEELNKAVAAPQRAGQILANAPAPDADYDDPMANPIERLFLSQKNNSQSASTAPWNL